MRSDELRERKITVLFVSHDLAAVRALCSRAILLNGGRIVIDGAPLDVLNCYQKIIMEREQAYEAVAESHSGEGRDNWTDVAAPLSYTYRHGNRDAEIVAADLTDAARHPLEIVETGEPLIMRVAVRIKQDIENPIVGFLVRNRHGISAFGTNTREHLIEFGTTRRGDLLEAIFSFNCWLGVDDYSISCAVHSLDGEAYDWVDGTRFFRVTSARKTEGIANLNANVTARRVENSAVSKIGSELQEAARV
jgi:lipopolysaccharide transport system ATP-binding protein